MDIKISEELLSKTQLTAHEFLIEIATHLYKIRKLTMGQARNLAQLDQISFQQELSKRNIYIKYGWNDLEDDLQTIKELENF